MNNFKEENVYEWNTAQNEPLITLLLVLLKASLKRASPKALRY